VPKALLSRLYLCSGSQDCAYIRHCIIRPITTHCDTENVNTSKDTKAHIYLVSWERQIFWQRCCSTNSVFKKKIYSRINKIKIKQKKEKVYRREQQNEIMDEASPGYK
jgi:hypothetical protein